MATSLSAVVRRPNRGVLARSEKSVPQVAQCGTFYFNRAKGRFDKSEMKMKLDGSLDIEIGGMTTTVALTQDQTATVKTSDTNPLEKKGK